VLTCLFAFTKGGRAERIGAAVILGNLLAYVVAETRFHDQLINLVVDGLTAIAFLAIVVRFASFWQGAVMLFYAMQFSLHAAYFVMERPRDLLHSIANNVIFFAILASLATGTLLAWRRRRHLAPA
jgi:type III secretory pathway component EscS